MFYFLPRGTISDFIKLASTFVHLITDENCRDVNEEAYEDATTQIKEVLQQDEGDPVIAIFQLMKTLEIAVHTGDVSKHIWLLADTIHSAVNSCKVCASLKDKKSWGIALQHAVSAINSTQTDTSMSMQWRGSIIASELVRLKRVGIPYEIGEGNRFLSEKNTRRLCLRIEKDIIKVGGEAAANALLDLMRRSNRIQHGMLIHARSVSQLYGKSKAGTPWHYIYSLCMKHIDKPNSSRDPAKTMQHMEDLSVALAATYDVETHSAYEYMSISPHSFLCILREMIVYDELFAFPQMHPRSAAFILKNLLPALQKHKLELPIANDGIWNSVFEWVLEASNGASIKAVHPFQLPMNNASQEALDKIFAALLLKPSKRNQKYLTPTDTFERTSTFFPIIEKDASTYLIQPKGIASRALIERLFDLIRTHNGEETDKKIGFAFETVTEAILKHFNLNVTFSNAKYIPSKGFDAEIDFVIETDERIFIIECKKKPLKTASKRGEYLSQLDDFNKSYLKMMDQLTKHELYLRENGKIIFSDKTVLELKGRSIEKIALSLLDHGSIQDRTLVSEIFLSLMNAKMGAERKEAEKIIKVTNKLLSSLQNTMGNLESLPHDYGKDFWHGYMFSTWWLSADQLFFILEQSNDLWSGLRRIRHLTYRTYDFFYEFTQAAKLGEISSTLVTHAEKTSARAQL